MRNRRRGATCLLIAIVAVAAVWKPGSLEAQANGEAKNLKLRVPRQTRLSTAMCGMSAIGEPVAYRAGERN